MARRKKLQIVRPYQDEAAFVEAEGWTIRKRSVILVGAPDVEVGVDVRCDVSLESGQKLIRAEGRVVEQIPPQGDRPGGIKLRFQRVAPDTQKFISRVLANATQPIDSGPAASPGPLEPPAEAAAEEPAENAGEPSLRPEPAPPRRRRRKASDSGMHARVVPPVEPPPNREELLDRLRARHRRRVEDGEPDYAKQPRTREDAG